MAHSETILFVSHKQALCGVYEFGRSVVDALKASRKFDFALVECGGPDDYHAAVAAHDPAAIIYNYYVSTQPWLNRRVMARHSVPHVGVIHEVTQEVADQFQPQLFDAAIAPDPTLLLRNPLVFKTGRLVPRYENRQPLPGVLRIGSFGFGTPGKGFEALVARVQDEFDQAVIALNIPFSTFADADGTRARAIAERCRRAITKPGIQIEIDHQYFSNAGVLDFLARNSLNAFFYEAQGGRGISSALDAALAVGRPIAVTKSSMFRHVRHVRPSVTVEDQRLTDIIGRGFAPIAGLAAEWSAENLVWDYERFMTALLASRADKRHGIVAKVAGRLRSIDAFQAAEEVGARVARKMRPAARSVVQRLEGSPPGRKLRTAIHDHPRARARLRALRARFARPDHSAMTRDWIPRVGDDSHLQIANQAPVAAYQPIPRIEGLNRILDQGAFVLYQPAVDYLFRHMPAVMARKIPAANIQQAFVLDTVMRTVAGNDRPELLSVGSYEDTAALAVMLSGRRVDEIDPVLNYDLSTYMTKPSCKRGAYDVVFATSVIEHVADDEQFLRDIEELLAPGGVGVITCDFNDSYRPGDPLPVEDRRFYTQRDLRERMLGVMPRCALVDDPQWNCEAPDFSYGGCQYTFASFVFRKVR
jgi:SAM-dependent methyltransferase